MLSLTHCVAVDGCMCVSIRSMLVVFVRAGHGAGLMPTPGADADHIVEYTGAEVKVKYTPPY